MKGANYIDGRWAEGAVPFGTVNPSDLDETVGSYTKVG
jgi:aldehyde dehydrogenase (NAD+)